jgi:hypothetical protein
MNPEQLLDLEGAHREFAAMQNTNHQLEAQVRLLQEQITQLREQSLREGTASDAANPTTPSSEPPATRLLLAKRRLPDPSKFTGDRTLWPTFSMLVGAKLRIDLKDADNDERFHYVYSLLDGDVYRAFSSWASRTVLAGEHSAEVLLERLRRVYHDPNIAVRATNRLLTLKQGSQNFASFFGKFERLLTDAGGDEWKPEVKIAFLSNTLNSSMSRILLARDTPHNYEEYVDLLLTTCERMKGFDFTHSQQNRERNADQSRAPRAPDAMEWEPTIKTNEVSTKKRAKWVTQQELDARKAAGRCYRCGNEGHVIRNCPLLPATRPRIVRVNHANITEQMLTTDGDEGRHGSDQENE